MKKLLAIMLAGCLFVQPLADIALEARAEELIEESSGDVGVLAENVEGDDVLPGDVLPQGEIPIEEMQEGEPGGVPGSSDMIEGQSEISGDVGLDESVTGSDNAGAPTMDSSADDSTMDNSAGEPTVDGGADDSATDGSGADDSATDGSGADGSVTDGSAGEPTVDGSVDEPMTDGGFDMPTADGDGTEPENETLGESEMSDLPADMVYPETSDDTFSDEIIDYEIDLSDLSLDDPGLIDIGVDPESEPESEFESENDITLAEIAFETESETEVSDEFMPISAGDLANKSYLEVKLTASHPAVGQRKYTVSVSGPTIASEVFGLPGDGGMSGVARFPVIPGSYTVRITADKFAAYEQAVEVGKHQIARIEVENAPTVGGESGQSGMKGWMRLGDVTGDGAVTKEDVDGILRAMRSAPTDSTYNLNQAIDSVVDIADLQYAVQSLDASQTATVMVQSVPQNVLADESTTVSGGENLLSDTGNTVLKPKEEAPISAKNPVSVGFAFVEQEEEADMNALPVLEGMTIKATAALSDGGGVGNNISDGEAEVLYSYMDGGRIVPDGVLKINLNGTPQPAMFMSASTLSSGTARVEPDGSLVLDFGGQIAVKRVTIKITGTKKRESLVDIAKVEFVNDMDKRIPAPSLDQPQFSQVASSNEELLVSWTPQTNVTGYELCVSGPVKPGGAEETQTLHVSGMQHVIVSINDKSLINFKNYTIRVRSVNGEWKSGWAETTGTPAPASVPAPVDNVRATGGYRSIRVSWKDMDDANGYMVYYRKKLDGGDFHPVVDGFVQVTEGTGCLSKNSYTITGLDFGTEYELYVIGWNERGWGKPSITALATTESGDTPLLPHYKLINTSNGQGVLTAHILSAVCGDHKEQHMVESRLDADKKAAGKQPSVKGKTYAHSQWALGTVDDDYVSYWLKNDWDDGVSYPVGDYSKGVTVTLDKEYKMNYLTFTAADITANPERARITYWNSGTGEGGAYVESSLIRRLDKNNRPYYIVKFHEAVTADQIQLCIGTGYASIDLKIAEIHFHAYDPLDDQIMALYSDAMHTTLRDGVTKEEIDELERQLNIPDRNGEFHPLYDSLLLELKAARELLEMQLDPVIPVDNRITARKDGHLGFGGLNAWQPLGRTAATGETLVVYVGHNVKNIGESSNLRLIFTQYHAEANSLAAQSAPLKIGRNQVIVPSLTSNDFERGGQIYVAYEGNNSFDKYGIRVNGGVKIPVLNLYRKQGEEKKAAIAAYVEELGQFVQTLGEAHEANHSGKNNVNYAYDKKNCILNTTDLMMEHMMYSVPATQVWDAISGADDKAAKLEQSLDAMEQMMKLFYQHKGLSADAKAGASNQLPSQHLNIRYMRMFAGAFMYASGNHIGIEWDQTNLAGGASSMDSFGWGIAHEIGHDINQSVYAIAEITNNYFAQLITMKEKGTRFQYEDVYKKVTSGAVGRHPNVGVQLALYWQLHLAYDNLEDRHEFTDYQEQFNNLFFARVDTYARNPKAAPVNPDKALAKELTLGKDVDQNLMRLACAAAKKNILAFFERWGMTPDETTRAFAQQYETETKALWYVNDAARDYRAAHSDEDANSFHANVTAETSARDNQVSITISSDAAQGLTLGYEVTRSMYADGGKKSEVIGFVTADESGNATFRDTISTIDNRVMYYEVRAVDKFLNYSDPTDAGSAKISTGGALGKESWIVETTMTSESDEEIKYDADDPDGGYDKESGAGGKKSAIGRIIDNNWETDPYVGSSEGDAAITVDMRKVSEITSVRYRGGDLASLNISVSRDGKNWTVVKEAYEGCKECQDKFVTVWFDSEQTAGDKWISAYEARYVRLEIPQSGEITISEIDICGPSGDNIEFFRAEDSEGRGVAAVGKLSQAFRYGKEQKDEIPAGSLIFAGTYKGNPAYNVVILYDTEGNVIGAKDDEVNAEQIILAPDPEGDDLGDVSEGYWIYYVRPEHLDEEALAQVKGVRAELYRVDNAHTLENERVVSDTEVIQIPEDLPSVSLAGVSVPE